MSPSPQEEGLGIHLGGQGSSTEEKQWGQETGRQGSRCPVAACRLEGNCSDENDNGKCYCRSSDALITIIIRAASMYSVLTADLTPRSASAVNRDVHTVCDVAPVAALLHR